MADTLEETAKSALTDILNGGESRSHDGGSIKSASIDKINDIRNEQTSKIARQAGVRPLFRGINLSGMGY
jgi:hypothetical protein